jgi:hypothetical protein
MEQGTKTTVMGIIAITIGGMLFMGGLMFFLVTFAQRNVSLAVQIPPLVQMALGLLASAVGLLLWRGYATAKVSVILLILVAIGVVANVIFLLFVFASNFLTTLH